MAGSSEVVDLTQEREAGSGTPLPYVPPPAKKGRPPPPKRQPVQEPTQAQVGAMLENGGDQQGAKKGARAGGGLHGEGACAQAQSPGMPAAPSATLDRPSGIAC